MEYEFNLICGYNFDRGPEVFNNYVNILYKEKSEAKSTVERNIAKLMLNSLYGKFGMKDIYNNLKIVSPTEADKISKKYNYNLFVKLSNGKYND